MPASVEDPYYAYYLVRFNLSVIKEHPDIITGTDFELFDTTQPVAVTKFGRLGTYFHSLPSNKPAIIDVMMFEFRSLTKAEYQTYIEFNLFPEVESDYFTMGRKD